MHTGRPKARVALMLWCLAVSAGAVAACGSTGSGENRLVVNTFGDFGYRELYTRYEQSHPGLKIVERVVSYDDHHKNLQAHLLAGRVPATSKRSTAATSPCSRPGRTSSWTSRPTAPTRTSGWHGSHSRRPLPAGS